MNSLTNEPVERIAVLVRAAFPNLAFVVGHLNVGSFPITLSASRYLDREVKTYVAYWSGQSRFTLTTHRFYAVADQPAQTFPSEDVEALTAAFITALREEVALIERTVGKEGT